MMALIYLRRPQKIKVETFNGSLVGDTGKVPVNNDVYIAFIHSRPDESYQNFDNRVARIAHERTSDPNRIDLKIDANTRVEYVILEEWG